MNLAVWAERNGVARVTAYRWFRAGLLPVPAQRVGRLILVDGSVAEAGRPGQTVVYARGSSAVQKSDLDRQVARVTVWATGQQIRVDKVVIEVGSALNGHRRKFLVRCCAIRRSHGSWSSIGIGSAGSVLSTWRRLLPPRAGSCWWSIPLRSTTIWCAI